MPEIAGFASIGWSSKPNAFAAGQAAARMALNRLATKQIKCAILFGSSWYEQPMLLQGVRSIIGDTPLVGGSTAGEIIPEGPKSHSCALLLLAHRELAISIGSGKDIDKDPRLAGYRAAQEALHNFQGQKRSGIIIFGDGLLAGYSEVLRGIQEVIGTSSLVTGGLMADDLKFENTYQYFKNEVSSRSLSAILIGGTCAIGVGVEHGFAPISKPRRITKAKDNILYELDKKPASLVYEEYFGADIMEEIKQEGLTRRMIAYPLGVQLDSSNQFLLRNIKYFGELGSLVCTGEVIEGAWVQLMIGSKELALEAAIKAAKQAIQPLRTVQFAIILDSFVRKRLLGQEASLEIEKIREVIGRTVPVIGCYTYGEQTPIGIPYQFGRSSAQSGACLVIAVGQTT